MLNSSLVEYLDGSVMTITHLKLEFVLLDQSKMNFFDSRYPALFY